jgi:hypothetical protein
MITVDINPIDLKHTAQFLLAFPKEINTAKYRTLAKTVKWASGQQASKLAAENAMPVSIFKKGAKNVKGFRVRTSKIKFNTTKAQIWAGSNSVKARYLGKAKESKRGVTVGSGRTRRFYEEAFLIQRADGRPSVVYRNKNSRKIRSITEPVQSVSVDEIEAAIPGELYKKMDQEMNYILNVAKTKYQRTGRN